MSMLHWIAADLNGMQQAAGHALALYQEPKLSESVGVAHHLIGIVHYLQNELEGANQPNS